MKRVVEYFKKRWGLFDSDEISYAIETVGHATDRTDYEFKLRRRLNEILKARK